MIKTDTFIYPRGGKEFSNIFKAEIILKLASPNFKHFSYFYILLDQLSTFPRIDPKLRKS